MKPLKIGKYVIEKPIIQGGMGVGISWDQLAGNVSLEGGLGVISAVGTGYYENGKYSTKMSKTGRPISASNFYNSDATKAIIKNARKISGSKPLAVNILYADLVTAVGNGSLIAGKYYRITDYTHNNYQDSSEVAVYSILHPIIVKAVNSDTLSTTGIDPIFVEDVITYDINNTG